MLEKEEILKLCQDSYSRGKADALKTFIDSLQIVSDAKGLKQFSIDQIRSFVNVAQKVNEVIDAT